MILRRGLEFIHRNTDSKRSTLWPSMFKYARKRPESREPRGPICPLDWCPGLTSIGRTGPHWKITTSPEELDDEIALFSSTNDLDHIYEQTGAVRERSAFVSDDPETSTFIIGEWLHWFMTPRLLDHETSFTAEHHRLCRWGYALWDLERIKALGLMDRQEDDLWTDEDQAARESRREMGFWYPWEDDEDEAWGSRY